MPTFPKAVVSGLFNFTVTVVVNDPGPTVTFRFGVTLIDANGSAIDDVSGDLAPFLTPTQITAFQTAALALYTKAKAELIG
jgi:hypothetical protein